MIIEEKEFVETTILKIKYKRVATSQEITLTQENCTTYGYVATTVEVEGATYTVYYQEGNSPKDIEPFEIENNVATTKITYYTYNTYEHISPSNTKYTISYADTDKEGSGRNDQTGEMFRERIGYYMKLEVAWDLIPNTQEYNNWYKILTHLPPQIELVMLTPDGETKTIKAYRGDIQTDLYYYHYDEETQEVQQIWQSLGTTFIQWDITPYDDTKEPTLGGNN